MPTIAFLGFGLIGGSVAMALREDERRRRSGGRPRTRIAAWSPSGRGPRAGIARGIVDVAAPDPIAAMSGADLVVLAAPPLATLHLLAGLAGPWRAGLVDGTVVTDVASTKAVIVGRADGFGLRFVGGHPMAGRDTSGFEAASADLFVARPWVVVPGRGADDEAIASVEGLARSAGARPVRMAAAAHDAATAAISHLPLLAAVALTEAITGSPGGAADVAWSSGPARTLAATGWRDATRLASGSPDMAAGIIATNAAELAPRLRALRDAVDAWLALVDGVTDDGSVAGHVEEIRGRLAAARDALTDLPVRGPADR